MIQCKLCGKVVRTTQGLRGHMTFVHQLYASSKQPAELAIEQQPSKLDERVEQLTSKLELLDKRLANLGNKAEQQAEQQKRFEEYIITNGSYCWVKDTRINRCKCDLERLTEKYEKLSRFIQYEFAGIQDDILWEIALIHPEFRRRSHKLK